jgi:hypothetical protein
MNNFTYFGLILERRRIGRDDSNEVLEDFHEESSNLFNVVQLNSSVQMITQPVPLTVQDKDRNLIENFVGEIVGLK